MLSKKNSSGGDSASGNQDFSLLSSSNKSFLLWLREKKKSTRNASSININYPLVNEVFLTWICWLGVSSDCQPQPDLILSEPCLEVCPCALNRRLYHSPAPGGAAQTQRWPPLHISSLLGKQWPGPLIPEARPARHKLLPLRIGKAELAHTLCLPCSLAGGTFSFCRRSRLAGPLLGSLRSCFRLPRSVFGVGSVA